MHIVMCMVMIMAIYIQGNMVSVNHIRIGPTSLHGRVRNGHLSCAVIIYCYAMHSNIKYSGKVYATSC